MNRYEQLPIIIGALKPKSIVEVGTWNGERALILARAALAHNAEVQYTGYDLFEAASEETDAKELNVKPHFSEADVAAKLEALKTEFPKFSYVLVKGDTRQTLHGKPVKADFAYIDGGHSTETIHGDFAALRQSKVVILDDYYTPDAEGKCPDTAKFGCNQLLLTVQHSLLPQRDPVRGGGMVQMAGVGVAVGGAMNLQIQTRNCVADDIILANVAYAHARNVPTFPVCAPHQYVASMCGSGPTLELYKKQIAQDVEKGYKVVCVKSSHDKLIQWGIKPWGCMLLDPRDHVKGWLKEVVPEEIFLI